MPSIEAFVMFLFTINVAVRLVTVLPRSVQPVCMTMIIMVGIIRIMQSGGIIETITGPLLPQYRGH